MNILRISTWLLCFFLPITYFLIESQQNQNKITSPSRNTHSSSLLNDELTDSEKIITDNKEKSIKHLEKLLFENGQIVSQEEFGIRILKIGKKLDPSANNFSDLLTKAYIRSIVRYDSLIDQPSHFEDLKRALSLHPLKPISYLNSAIKVYGFDKAINLVEGGVNSLSDQEISTITTDISEDSIGNLANIISQLDKFPRLTENALSKLFLSSQENVPDALKWQILSRITKNSNRDEAIAAMAGYLTTQVTGSKMPDIPLSDPLEVKKIQSAIIGAIMDKNLAQGTDLIIANPSLKNENLMINLREKAIDYGGDDLPELENLISRTEDPEIKKSLQHGQFMAWGAFAPHEAAKAAYEGMKSGVNDPEHLITAMSNWFFSSPTQAADFIKSTDLEGNQKQQIISNFLPNIARNAPEYYNSYLSESDDAFYYNFHPSMIHKFAKANLEISNEHAIEQVDRLPPSPERFDAYQVTSNYISRVNLFQAVEYAANTRDKTKRDAIILGTIPEALNHDLQYTQKLIEQISNDERQAQAYQTWLTQVRRREPSLGLSFLNSIQKTNPNLYQKLNQLSE